MEWPEIFDLYEDHLDRVEEAIAGTGPWPGNFVEPPAARPLSRAYERRARELVERTTRLGDVLAQRMAVCNQVLNQSRARNASGRVVLVDVKA